MHCSEEKTDLDTLLDDLSPVERLRFILGPCTVDPLRIAKEELVHDPLDPHLLKLVSLAALLDEKPAICLKYSKRLTQRYEPNKSDHLLSAIANAQKENWSRAAKILRQYNLECPQAAQRWFIGQPSLRSWLKRWLKKIAQGGEVSPKTAKTYKTKPTPKKPIKKKLSPSVAVAPPELEVWTLPEIKPNIPIQFQWPDEQSLCVSTSPDFPDHWFRLRREFSHLGLLQGFDKLLCLPDLQNVKTDWYEVEAVRKVLKQFRGRVLLADEVGLGKTVEAGMVLKEYLLRGMVERVLILTPASLVGQWQEEMLSKFSIDFTTSYDSLVRRDPTAFWAHKKVIASIAVARRKEHFDLLTSQSYDLVIVDEAHHLKNRTTRNWKLVDALKKRFLVLLSATPVQNNLVELYNLLTLLKPGIFKTEKEFRSAYITPRKPRLPVNHGRLRDLMRDVMIRNTRSVVDVRMPPRQAMTLRIEAGEQEKACYQALSQIIQASYSAEKTKHRLAFRHMLTAAGSIPQAVVEALKRFITRHEVEDKAWIAVFEDYQDLKHGCKEKALIELLVFVHHRETLTHLADLLQKNGVACTRFDGSMSGPDKDAAVAKFSEDVPVLLCGESGGEGRNLQFCNTLINFDLPWNPMAIEQRIGRIHRIGQTREVFIFNLVVRDTIEDNILQILDEKINMFELVVGEVGAILGEMDENEDFSEMVFSAWVDSSEQDRSYAFSQLGERMISAQQEYEAVKSLDDELFGNELESG